jgi:hypothetical protein
MEAQEPGDIIYYIWFFILLLFIVILFFAKLKFSEIYKRREERRRMLSYSRIKLSPTEEGKTRAMKVRRIRDL